jgi:hypothetical protein
MNQEGRDNIIVEKVFDSELIISNVRSREMKISSYISSNAHEIEDEIV